MVVLFNSSGYFRAGHLLEDRVPLEQRENSPEVQDKTLFLQLMQKMLQWDPTKRSSARELQEDEWIRKILEI